MKAFHCPVILGSSVQSTHSDSATIWNPQWLWKHKSGVFFVNNSCCTPSDTVSTWTQSHLQGFAVDSGCSLYCEMAWLACLGLLGGTLFRAWLLDYPSVCEGCLPFHIMVWHLVIIYLTSACFVNFSSHSDSVCVSNLWLWMRVPGIKNIHTPHFPFVKLSFHGCFPKKTICIFHPLLVNRL